MALVLIVFVTHKGSGSKESLASFYHVLFVTHALPLLATRSLRASHRSAPHRHAAPHRIALSQLVAKIVFFRRLIRAQTTSACVTAPGAVLNLARWTARRASVAPRHFPFGSATSAGATAPGAAAASAQLFS